MRDALFAYADVWNETHSNLSKLKRLGIEHVKGVRASYLDSMQLEDLVGEILSELKNVRTYDAFFGFSKFEFFYPEKRTLEEDNAYLKLAITQRELEMNTLINDCERNRLCAQLMMAAFPTYDTMQQIIDKELPLLLEMRVITEAELKQQRELYRSKGPGGFSEDYAQLFPDVFPKPKPIEDEVNDYEGVWMTAPPEPKSEDRFSEEAPEVYDVVEVPAEFPGGMKALKEYMAKELRYPPSAREMAIQGKVYVRFEVMESGDIANVKVVRGISDCPECDAEAVRMVKGMPKWKPAEINGGIVRSRFNLPVNFTIN